MTSSSVRRVSAWAARININSVLFTLFMDFELGILDFEFLQLSAFQFQLFLPVVPVAASVKTKLGLGGGE